MQILAPGDFVLLLPIEKVFSYNSINDTFRMPVTWYSNHYGRKLVITETLETPTGKYFCVRAVGLLLDDPYPVPSYWFQEYDENRRSKRRRGLIFNAQKQT